MRLLSNYLSKCFEDFIKDPIKSSILSETAYGVVASAQFAVFVLFNVKNKNMLNKRGPKIESCDTPNNVSYHKPYESFTRTLLYRVLFDK